MRHGQFFGELVHDSIDECDVCGRPFTERGGPVLDDPDDGFLCQVCADWDGEGDAP